MAAVLDVVRAFFAPHSAPAFVIENETPADVVAREALLDRAMGADRRKKSSEKIRRDRLPAEGLAFTAEHDGRVVGTVRLWHVSAAGIPALVLGPLAVDASCRKLGIGAALMRHALKEAATRGHGAVILRGDPDYYARFGFNAAKTGDLALPGPFERERLLAVELRPGALDEASGMIVATGAKARRPRARHRKAPTSIATHAA